MASTPYIPGQGTSNAAAYCEGVECYLEAYKGFIANPAVIAGQAALGIGATLVLLNLQESQYEDVRDEQRDIIDDSVKEFCANVEGCLDSNDFEDAYPDVPEAALYVPVDACAEKGGSYQCIVDAIALSEKAASDTDKAQIRNSLLRAVLLDPKYVEGIELYACQIQDLLSHKSPLGVNLKGTATTNRLLERNFKCLNKRQSLRSMGISRMSAMELGRREMDRELEMINGDVAPIARNMDLTRLMRTPQQRIGLALTQAQLIQQSLQNLNNRNSLKPPARLAELQTKINKLVTKLSLDASKANLVSQYVPNYAGIFQPQINALTGAAATGLFGGGAGGVSQPNTGSPTLTGGT